MALTTTSDAGGAAPVGAQQPAKRRLTDEQMACVQAVRSNRVVAAQAFAGTGKTSTGVATAHSYPKQKILVLCFNTANAKEGMERYPRANTTVMTTHGLAYQHLEDARRARLATQWNAVTLKSELAVFGHKADYGMAAMVQGVLQDFFQSRSKSIDPDVHGAAAFERMGATDFSRRRAGDLAHQFWSAMKTSDTIRGMRTSTNGIMIPHDAYLKQFALSSESNWGYDLVIFDEAQDANPVTLDLLERQAMHGSHLMYLGDRHQAIYDFRGAVNAMEHLPSDACRLPLTQSWRFGPDTAFVANLLLNELKGEPNKLQGMGEDRDFDLNSPYAYIARTNADLLAFAIAKSGDGDGLSPIHWLGGIENYRVHKLADLHMLSIGRADQMQDPYLKRHFRSWAEFRDSAQHDPESKLLLSLVEDYGNEIPRLIQQLVENATEDPAAARYFLSTGHKSKGMEWDQVQMANDFRAPLAQAEAWLAKKTRNPFPEAEINLFYVMATRARHALLENHELIEWRHSLHQHRSERVRQYSPEMRDVTSPVSFTANRARSPGAIRIGSIRPMSLRRP